MRLRIPFWRQLLPLALVAVAFGPRPAAAEVNPPPIAASEILRLAESMLGVPYVFGGTTPAGFDCSGYLSYAWAIPHRTTDTLADMVTPITKEELLPGDAMNNPEPGRVGHVRIFEKWANAERSRVWVFEETGPRSMHRVVSYSPKLRPVRRLNVISDVPLPPATPADVKAARSIDRHTLPIDYDVPNGHFYTQRGSSDGAHGFAITNEGGIRFWDEFQRLGGVSALGYPVTSRFTSKGLTVQVMQKGVLQWHDVDRVAVLTNVFDEMHDAGKDDWLNKARSTPRSLDGGFDAGKSWDAVVAGRIALLDDQARIAARYSSVANPMTFFGLPTSRIEDMGNHYAIRLQRAVIQLWKVDVPWAKAGETTVANGGDVAKEAGVLPAAAAAPQLSPLLK